MHTYLCTQVCVKMRYQPHPFCFSPPLAPLSRRCTSMNVMRDNYSMGGSVSGVRPPSILLSDVSPTPLPRPPLASISQLQEMNASASAGVGVGVVAGNVAIANPSNTNGNINNNHNNNHNANGIGSALAANGNGGAGGNGSAAASARDSRTLPVINRINSRSVSQDSVYTILIRLPSDGASSNAATGNGANVASSAPAAASTSLSLQGDCAPSIKMIHEDAPSTAVVGNPTANATGPPATRRPLPSRDSEVSLPLGRRMSHAQHDARLLNAKVIPKQLGKGVAGGAAGAHALLNARNAAKKKKKSQEKRQESKAAKTLSAILLSFIITWTPYNILVLIKPLTTCSDCIPTELWDFFYALCYINSTINPMCYALCNASFRRTYIRILTCKWHTRNREGMVRGVYN